MTDVLTSTIEGHVATVTLNRPDKHNAINMEMFAALAEAGEQLGSQPSVRAVVLTGAGENFCSGIDTSVFKQAGAGIDPGMMAPVGSSPANFFQRPAYVWRELEKPVICALQGVFRFPAHAALYAIVKFFFKARRIQQSHRLIQKPPFRLPPVTGDAGRVVHDSQLLTRQAVKQCGFADIRAADEGDAGERDHRGLRLTPETGKAYTSRNLGGGPSP